MKRTMNSLRGDVVFMLEKYSLLYEDITTDNTKDGITITLTRKNNPKDFQNFIHYLNAENINYYAYFCQIVKRIKVSIFLEQERESQHSA